jgi:hypothetical protein
MNNKIVENELTQLMEENLQLVWSERDEIRRMKAIKNIYTEAGVLYHVGHKTEGVDAISNSVADVLNNMPANFVFTKLKPVIINNNIGRLVWGIGPEGQAPVATGMDIAHFENGKIKSLYVFLDH